MVVWTLQSMAAAASMVASEAGAGGEVGGGADPTHSRQLILLTGAAWRGAGVLLRKGRRGVGVGDRWRGGG